MRDWLELELAEELRPAAAPDELWERVRVGIDKQAVAGMRPPVRRSRTSWPIAAILTMAVAAATLWLVARGQDPGLDLRQMAILELRGAAPAQFSSSDPAEVNNWMRREAGIDLSLPEHSGARITGARVIRKGESCVGVVSYKVGEDSATLLVTRAAASTESVHGHRSWESNGLSYAVATSSAEHSDAACRLCHMAL